MHIERDGANKSIRKLLLPLNRLEPTHVGLQYVGHGDRSTFLLVSFHDRNQCAADSSAGTVQGVEEARLAVGGAIARVHAPRLKFAAQRSARDLPECAALALARHPDLDV